MSRGIPFARHETVSCSCGATIRTCRCPGPKSMRVVENGCSECKSQALMQRPAPNLEALPPVDFGPGYRQR